MQERLDRTDRELLRQLEEAQNNDRSDKLYAGRRSNPSPSPLAAGATVSPPPPSCLRSPVCRCSSPRPPPPPKKKHSDALAAIVETKADKALTERWLEASQQLHGELQTVHVRTQTLGQGMKVVLGWVEGMADKVTGLQGAQHRMAQQVQNQREEQQVS